MATSPTRNEKLVGWAEAGAEAIMPAPHSRLAASKLFTMVFIMSSLRDTPGDVSSSAGHYPSGPLNPGHDQWFQNSGNSVKRPGKGLDAERLFIAQGGCRHRAGG